MMQRSASRSSHTSCVKNRSLVQLQKSQGFITRPPAFARTSHRVYSTTEEALETAESAMSLFYNGNKESLISFIHDSVIDRCLEQKREKLKDPTTEDLTFDELLELSKPNEFIADSFAMRALFLGRPLTPPLWQSTLKLTDEKCIHRYSVTTTTGEEMYLVLELKLEDTLEPKYRGLQCVKRWFIKGVTGEPACPIAENPSPEYSPESVVDAQLEALKIKDIETVFLFASPANQKATGPIDNFKRMLNTAAYQPLLGHHSSAVLKSAQMTVDKCFEIVGITSQDGEQHVYCWVVELEGKSNCWLTSTVFPISGDVQFRNLGTTDV